MIKRMKITAWTAMLLLTGLVMSCNNLSEDEIGMEGKGTGTVVFKITDAPFPVDLVEEANVTIDWIKLLKYPSEEMVEESTVEDEVILIELDEPATFNLIELRNGLTATMADMEVPAGAYAEIRLHVIDAGILLKDGSVFNLKVPSGSASGLKIKLGSALDVVEGAEAEVLFDFDLSRSFVMQGNSKNIQGFIFKPVVRAVANVQTETGIISGTVLDQDENPVAGASLTLIKDEEVITTANPMEEDGYYSMVGILPGTYNMLLEIGEYSEEIAVTVEATDETILNFVVETVSETEAVEESAE